MWAFVGKALAGMVLTKEARQAAADLAQSALKNAGKKTNTTPSEQGAVDPLAPAAVLLPQVAPTERSELIRQAMQVRAAKQTVLAELDEKDRAKLVETAMRAFLNESKPKE